MPGFQPNDALAGIARRSNPVRRRGWASCASFVKAIFPLASRFGVVKNTFTEMKVKTDLVTMNSQSHFPKTFSRRAFAATLLGALLLLPLAMPQHLLADELYLKSGQVDWLALLPPPPTPGSAEQEADLNESRMVFKACSPADRARALKDAKLSFSIFEPAIGPVFQPDKLPKAEALLKKIRSEMSDTINAAKDHWQRPRPFRLDSSLLIGQGEKGFSYPSGHSTWGTLYSLVLSEIFPDKKEALLETGRTIGWDRVLIGVHYHTDVFAGRVLGKAMFNELMKSPEFQKDLEAAKAEARAAKQ